MNIPTQTDGPDSMKCAHRRIISVLLEQPNHPERGYSEQWECATCGKRFAPVPMKPTQEQVSDYLDELEHRDRRIRELESCIRWRRFSDESPKLKQTILWTNHFVIYREVFSSYTITKNCLWIPCPLDPLPEQKPEQDACVEAFLKSFPNGSSVGLKTWRTAWAKARETKKEAQ